MKLADYAITEAGFGADLGAEKFLDIKCRFAGLKPSAIVLVTTVRAMKYNGGIALPDLKEENVDALVKGSENLVTHIENLHQYGVPIVVAINKFGTDTDAEISTVARICAENGAKCAVSDVFSRGGEGGIELAEKVCRKLMVGFAGGTAIDIERDAELLERVLDHLVVTVDDILRRDAFLACTNGNGHTMLVASTDKHDIFLLQSQVADIDVGRHIDTSQVSDMYTTVGVWQCRRHGGTLILFLFHV
jgi:hypothetical protein